LLRPKRLNAADFDAFLRRQTEALQARRVDEMLKSAAAVVTPPQLCRRRIELAETRLSQSFYDRQQAASEARLQASARRSATADADGADAFTFTPVINRESRRRAARGAAELSSGEMKRRAEQLEELRKETAERERRLVTFAPELTARSRHAESSPGIRRDPAHFAQKLQKAQADRAAAQQAEQERVAAEERKTLTFAPEIRGVPAYLRKLSASMERIKQHEGTAARRSYTELALRGQQKK
jgi:hypothetical protein